MFFLYCQRSIIKDNLVSVINNYKFKATVKFGTSIYNDIPVLRPLKNGAQASKL